MDLSMHPRDFDGSVQMSTSSSQSPPAKRRRPAPVLTDCCRTCRLRKVKCTGNVGKGPCTNCSRLELTCSFVGTEATADSVSRTTPSHSHTEAGTLRKRAQRACSQCHAHKTKCSGDLPRCKRCESGNLQCEYTPAKRKFTNVRFQSHSPTGGDDKNSAVAVVTTTDKQMHIIGPSRVVHISPSAVLAGKGNFPLITDVAILNAEEMLLRKNLLLQHFDVYLNHLYWLPSLGFLHPETTYRKIHEGTFNPAQAAALCALSSFFINPGAAGREFGNKCCEQVENHIFHSLYKFSEDLLILSALSISFNLLSGSYAKVWQCFGVATRLMMGLQVNWDVAPQNRSFIQQEVLRRVAWQIFIMDRLLAGGYEEYISCRSENMKIPLPCNETAFRENRPVMAERLHDKPGSSPNTVGMHGFLVRLADLRHRIQVTTKKLAAPAGPNKAHLEPSKVMADINALQNELTRFHSAVPDDLRLSDHSISRYMTTQERPGYVYFHTHLSACHSDLYRFALPDQPEQASQDVLRKLPREFVLKSQRQAVAHALCLGRFCEAIQKNMDEQPDTGLPKLAGDYTIFHMASRGLQVLLVALDHHLYQDLENDTTAPLWRNGPTDEARVRSLCGSLLKITEPWCQVFHLAQGAFDHNKALLDEYDRKLKLLEQRSPTRNSDTTNGSSHFPGPDYMLDNQYSNDEDGRRSRSGDPATPGRWQRVQTAPGVELVPYPNGDGEYGPPGLPLFLAQARDESATLNMPLMYDSDKGMIDMGSVNGSMTSDGPPQLMPSPVSSIPSIPLNMNSDINMFHPVPQMPAPPQPHAGFMPPQQGLFMGGGYPAPFGENHGGSAHFMHQPSF